jgi:hypothetical protein
MQFSLLMSLLKDFFNMLHRLIYMTSLPFYDSSAISHGSFERSRDSK